MSLREDGLRQHVLTHQEGLHHQALKAIVVARFPVAWIDGEARLAAIVDGLRALIGENDGKNLGQMSGEALSKPNADSVA